MNIKNLINLSKAAILCIGLIITSCSKEEITETSGDQDTELLKRYFNDNVVLVKDLGDGNFQSGDIIYAKEQLTEEKIGYNANPAPDEPIDEKLGLGRSVNKWTNNTIVYVLDGSLSSSVRSELFKSMDVWRDNTNIRFKERTNESNYITISSNGDSCNCGVATLGMNGSRGFIRLGTRTTAVVIIHEIGHTLGYLHEQTRSDRDNHVRILWDNIQSGAESQFRKDNYSVNLGEFDIESTMMYGQYTFSKNGNPTITRLDGSSYPRPQARLSAGDIAGTNQAYPVDTTDDGDPTGGDDMCEGIEEWSSNVYYRVGDKVTYRGSLYQRDYSRWNRLGECGEDQPADICEGVSQYSRYTNYTPGDKVTYNNYLYKLGSDYRWSNQGQCGN